MRTVVHSMTASVDGYVTDPDGGIDWSEPDPELHQFHNDRARGMTAQLCGSRLYDVMRYWDDEHPEWDDVARDFAEVWAAIPKIVFSSTLSAADLGPNARLATGGVVEEVLAIPDGRVGVGGPTLARELTAHGLIDEYHLFIAPVILGGGTPYVMPGAPFTPLRLVDQRVFAGGVTHLHLRRAS